MTAKYGIYFNFLCKQGGISPFGESVQTKPDGFIWVIQESSIFNIFHTMYNDRYNGFIYIYEVRVLV